MNTTVADDVRHLTVENYISALTELKNAGYNMCIDVTAVDYLRAGDTRQLPQDVQPERFEVVVGLLSHRERHRIRVRVQVPAANPVIPSLFALYPGTEAMEREAFDLMGVVFDGHPDLTRILLPEDWEGHPLRKDYAQGRIPVQFKHPEGKGTVEGR